jgi:hypothetical protein
VNGLSPAACATASFTSFLKIAASFAAGRPVDLCAVITNSLGWAHARLVLFASSGIWPLFRECIGPGGGRLGGLGRDRLFAV